VKVAVFQQVIDRLVIWKLMVVRVVSGGMGWKFVIAGSPMSILRNPKIEQDKLDKAAQSALSNLYALRIIRI